MWLSNVSSLNATKKIFSFFFSSRRRHTRCYRDWSSDVCSSDLISNADDRHLQAVRLIAKIPTLAAFAYRHALRSEERRVGKECRTRRARYKETEDQRI